jgi:hypothetical protein
MKTEFNIQVCPKITNSQGYEESGSASKYITVKSKKAAISRVKSEAKKRGVYSVWVYEQCQCTYSGCRCDTDNFFRGHMYATDTQFHETTGF